MTEKEPNYIMTLRHRDTTEAYKISSFEKESIEAQLDFDKEFLAFEEIDGSSYYMARRDIKWIRLNEEKTE